MRPVRHRPAAPALCARRLRQPLYVQFRRRHRVDVPVQPDAQLRRRQLGRVGQGLRPVRRPAVPRWRGVDRVRSGRERRRRRCGAGDHRRAEWAQRQVPGAGEAPAQGARLYRAGREDPGTARPLQCRLYRHRQHRRRRVCVAAGGEEIPDREAHRLFGAGEDADGPEGQERDAGQAPGVRPGRARHHGELHGDPRRADQKPAPGDLCRQPRRRHRPRGSGLGDHACALQRAARSHRHHQH